MRKYIALTAIFFFVIAAIFFSACNNSTTEPQADNKEDSLKKVVARGEYLATYVSGCLDCHSKRDWTKFSGPVMPGTEGMGGEVFSHELFDAMPGTVYARNITSDPETGIGSWTDEEILRAMTQGINKNGDTLFPLMPYANFNHMATEDLLSIIAYLRTLKPIKNAIPARHLFVSLTEAYPPPQALQPSVDANAAPPETDKVAYGGYLVAMADCGACHTPYVQGQPDFSRMLSGGNTFTLETFKVTSANLTPDSATGTGTWTEDAFVEKFKNNSSDAFVNTDPGKMNSIMPWSLYGKMGDEKLKAIYAYLRTIPPISNKVEKYPK